MDAATLGVMFSSDKSDWETPQSLYFDLDSEFHFTLDAAASDENHKCRDYFTAETDGLSHDWGGANRLCEPAVWKYGDGHMDEEVLRGI